MGGLIETEHDGLAGLDQARREGFCQFFTPPDIGVLIDEFLRIPGGATVLEPSIGSGSLVFEIQNGVKITGIEIEPDAFSVAKVCLPYAHIVQDDLINHKPKEVFDYVLANPPYSMILQDQRQIYYNKNFQGHILSHLACFEMSIEAVGPGGYVAMILPSGYLEDSETVSFHRWLNNNADLIARVELPKDTFSATDWKTSLFIYRKPFRSWDTEEDPPLKVRLEDLKDSRDLLGHWQGTPHFIEVLAYAKTIETREKEETEPNPIELKPYMSPEIKPIMRKKPLPVAEIDQVKVFFHPKKTTIKPLSLGAELELKEVELKSVQHYDRKTDHWTNEWLELLGSPSALHNEEVINTLGRFGLDILINRSERTRLDNSKEWLRRQESSYWRYVQNGNGNGENGWKKIDVKGCTIETYKYLFEQRKKEAKELGLDSWLLPFQLDDVCRMSLKQNNLLAYQQGLGKTRTAIALQQLYGSKRGLYIASNRLLMEWENELKKLGFDYKIIEHLRDCGRLKEINLISYEKLWRIPKDSSHYGYGRTGYDGRDRHPLRYSFSHILKKEFSFISIDEAYNIKNPASRRARAVFNLHSKHKLGLTGTPVKGYPQNILGILNWLFGCGSATFPEFSYRKEGGVKKFLEKFGTYIYYDTQHEKEGDRGKKKQIPKIRNVDKFYEMLRGKMIRRLKAEPDVAEHIKTKDPIIKYVDLELTDEHREFYGQWIQDFIKWYELRRQEEGMGGKKLGQMEILAKLGYLIQVAGCPQSSHLTSNLANSVIGTYNGGLTSLQEWVVYRVKESVDQGNKVIVFSRFLDSIHLLAKELSRFNPVVITGDVSLSRSKRTGKSRRQNMIQDFRWNGKDIMVAGMGCLCEGLNIPEANVGIFADFDWTPSIMLQGLWRMVRPEQTKQVTGYFLNLKGTIFEYMKIIVQLKQRAIDEGIDHIAYDFKVSEVPDIRQYCRAIVETGGKVPAKRMMYLKKELQEKE